MRDDRRGSLEAVTWTLILVAGSAVAGWLGIGQRSLAWGSVAAPALASVFAAGLGLFYRHARPDERLATTLVCLAQLIAFPAIGALLSYLMASLGRPLWDATFLRWDLALGLDWRAHLATLNQHPGLASLLGHAYASILPQMFAVVTVLGLTGRRAALQRFVFAYVLAGLVTIVVSGAMPAMALYVHLGLGPADYPNLAPAAARVHVAAMEALRSGGMPVITLDGSEGLITFPSFHATLSILFMTALWAVPSLRWAGLVVNLGMLAATPVHGGHYYVDVLAGIALAILALLAADAVALRRRRRAREALPAPA